MPIYEYHCNKCKITIGEYDKIENYNKVKYCECGRKMRKVYSLHSVHSFKEQDLNITITDRKTGNEKVLHARNKQDVRDAMNRYNDTPEAAKTGKVTEFVKLGVREI